MTGFAVLLSGCLILAFSMSMATAYMDPQAPLFRIDKSVLHGTQVKWVNWTAGNQTNGYANSWLGMALNFPLIKEAVFDVLNNMSMLNLTGSAYVPPLSNRGESHITVLTPPEYNTISAVTNITIADINAIAMASNIQASEFEIKCVARYRKALNYSTPQNCNAYPYICNFAYNLIVTSPDLVAIRQRISDLFQMRGGEPGLFDPNYFLPHITVAYQTGGRDMFDSDGVFKGKQACWAPIVLGN